jgi:hypothetical protein
MNGAGDVDLAGHAGVGDVARQPKTEAHFAHVIERQSIVRARRVQLMEIDREVTLPPHLAPTADERMHPVVVVHSLGHARIALVPDRAADGIRDHRIHPAVEHPGCVAVAFHVAGRLGGNGLGRFARLHQLGIAGKRVFRVLIEFGPSRLVFRRRGIRLDE